MAADTLREHQAIVNAIARRDAAGARAAARRHMDMTKKRNSKDWKK
jgi:DNA-binding FadR family transcriptional regulator